MTTGGDAQRSFWIRTDAKISPASLRKPGFELVWKIRPDVTVRQLNSLTSPALLDFYIGYRGFRALGFFGSANDYITAVDIDLAKTEWQKSLAGGKVAPAGTPDCPGGMTSAVTRPMSAKYPPLPLGRGGAGRGTPAKSGVGEPNQGAITIKKAQPNRPRPAPVKPAAAAAALAASPFAPRVQYVLALNGDGKLHMMWVSNGNETAEGIPFVPAGANAMGLVSYDGVTYVSTTSGCEGIDSGVWALDMTSKQVAKWKAPGKGVIGTAGQAAGPDGTVYVSTDGGELTALMPKTLEPVSTYKTGGPEFTSSPVVFEYREKDMVAATTADGRLHLIHTQAMKEAISKTSQFSGENFAAGALATWLDSTGTRWVLAPAGGGGPDNKIENGAIVAFKVMDVDGTPKLIKGWTSRDLQSPMPPAVINGVVFALSSGEFRGGDPGMSAEERAKRSKPAVLYALDGMTGKELWNSGDTIQSFVHSGGLAAGGSRIYVGTYDGTQYAFSFPIEH